MLYLTIALLIVAAIAAGYAVKQTNIAKAMQEKHDDEQTEVRDWQVRHEVVAIQLTKINPLLQMRYADGTTRVVYIDLFPDPALQQAIETYIVEPNRPHTQFTVRKPPAHELRSPALRETVKTVEARIARFREENPVTAGIFKTTFH